jgi:transcription-repair coupling factor (superfamily II helicase)
MIEQVQKLVAGGTQVILAVPNTGEVERLADMFTEYNASYRLGSRTRSGESYADETSYFAGDVFTTTLLKAYLARRLRLPEAHLAIFGARDLFDESDLVAARPQRQKSKVSAFLSDFRDLAGRRLRGPRGARHWAISRLKGNQPGRRHRGIHAARVCRRARLYVPLTRLDLVQKYRSAEGAKPVLNHLGTQPGARPRPACARR